MKTKVLFHHLANLIPWGKNQQELFDIFDSDFYLIEALFLFK